MKIGESGTLRKKVDHGGTIYRNFDVDLNDFKR